MRRKMSGISLLEVMIYVALSTIITLSITSTVIYNQKSVSIANAINRVQDTGRNILSTFDYNVENAGFAGYCINSDNSEAETIDMNAPQNVLYDLRYPIVGWHGARPNFLKSNKWAQVGDIVLIQYASNNNYKSTDGTFEDPQEFYNASNNARVLVSDIEKCEQTTRDKVNVSSLKSNTNTKAYVLHSYLYYLSDKDDDTQTYTLKRLNFDTTSGTNYENAPEEVIAKGVKSFQVLYSVKKNSGQNWKTADEVTNQEWSEINSIRLGFIVVDSEQNTLTNNKQFTILNETSPIIIEKGRASDSFVKTINIRNRLL